MNYRRFRPRTLTSNLMALGFIVSSPGFTQVEPPSGRESLALEEVVVSARRMEENIQEVPITVNAVNGRAIEELNIRDFADIQSVVPGLNLEPGQISGTASIRGVRFDSYATSSGTVEFYLNDAWSVNNAVLQSMYDIEQVEVLRGPQGTLRGKASPSGSVTLTTRRPEFDEVSGDVNAYADDIGGSGGWAAVNLPVLDNMLAVRLAGLYDVGEVNRVKSINNGDDPHDRTQSGRLSIRFDPTENLGFDFFYQHLDTVGKFYDQAESANIAAPSLAPSYALVKSEDRKAVEDIRTDGKTKMDIYNLRADWDLGGQTLYYVGAYTEFKTRRKQPDDVGDFFYPAYPEPLQTIGQYIKNLHSKSQSQELRIQSNEPVFDKLDYVAGVFYTRNRAPTQLINPTPIFFGPPSPTTASYIYNLPIYNNSITKEVSGFANLTWHFSDDLDLSAGTRYINYNANSYLEFDGVIQPSATTNLDYDHWIYSATLKYQFTDELMAYASYGSSWRAGNNVVGDFSANRSELENYFSQPPPETSDNYEIGFKSTWFDNRLLVNGDVFYQDFDNYPFRVPGDGVYYVSTNARDGVQGVQQFNFVGPVPVDVTGMELEVSLQLNEQWYISGFAAYAKGEIQDGFVPCDDYFPPDGKPDTSQRVPTVEEIIARTGGETMTGCNVDYKVSFAPEWSGSIQSEYSFPLVGFEGFVRGQSPIYGDSDNDPSNALDDVNAYALLNLYVGIRDPGGRWEVMVYGANVFDTERRLNRGKTPSSILLQITDLTTPGFPTVGENGVSGYRTVSLTPPQAFGLNMRYAF